MTRRVAFVHYKGGTGKTTSCVNLAGWLARMQQKVLVLDLDPQGSAVAGLGLDRGSVDTTLYDVLLEGRHIGEAIYRTDSGVFAAPSSLDLLSVELRLSRQAAPATLLNRHLEELGGYFDFILIDAPPGSTLLMISSIVATRNIIVPLDSGVFAFESLEILLEMIQRLYEEWGAEAEVDVPMVLMRKFSRSMMDAGVTKEMQGVVSEFLARSGLQDTRIVPLPFSKKVHQSLMRGMPLSHTTPRSDIARAYEGVARELLNHHGPE